MLIGLIALAGGLAEAKVRTLGGSLLLLAIAWFPNQVAGATGRLNVGPAVSRASSPWVLLVFAWLMLLFLGLATILGSDSRD